VEDVGLPLLLEGFRLEPKGQGIAVVAGREYARFSDLGAFARMKRLEARFKEPFSGYRRRPAQLVDGIGHRESACRHGLAERKDITEAVQDVIRARGDRPQTLRKTVRTPSKRLCRQATDNSNERDR